MITDLKEAKSKSMPTSDDESNEEGDAPQDAFEDEFKDKNGDDAGDDKVAEEQAGFTSLVSSLEIENPPQQGPHQNPSVSFLVRMVYAWWMDTQRLFKVMVVVSILVVVIITIQSSKYRQQNSLVVVWDPDDLVSCDVRKYNQTYEKFMDEIRSIENPNDFCEAGMKLGSKTCKCLSPTKPVPVNNERWEEAFEKTKEISGNALDLDPLQLVLVGGSLTEHWNGLSVGRPVDKLNDIKHVFEEVFTEEGGGKINAVALGIAGDRAPNLLYRIQNGGIGVLDPDVWWVLIGINDLTDDFCNVDAIVAANIAVVEEIISLRPKATVVINSLLPRTPTFWVYLSQINERLKCYAAMTYQVEFFNATDIFMLSDGTLRNLPDDVHPDAEGSRIWGEEIVQEVLNLIGY